MLPEVRPDCWGIAEVHLRGTDLNATRRRLKKIGWRSFSTPAISKAAKETGSLDTDGGELVLLAPHLQASGHRQDPQASGYRSVIIRFKGWSLHFITVYLDSNFGLENGPNGERTMAIANLIRNIGLPWLMLGDFNRAPAETASSTWCRFLKGTVSAPRVPFTCTNSSEQGGSLIDYAMHSEDLAPYLELEGIQDFPFKPHVISLKATIHREVAPDEAYTIDAPTEISQGFGPRNYMDNWWMHWARAE